MNIDSILNKFKDCGYLITERSMVDLGHTMEQTMIKKIPKDQVKERYERNWTIHYINDPYNYFSIFENYDVISDGVSYYDPNHFHYFYSIGSDVCKVYHENDLCYLYNDLISDLVGVLNKSELRQLKLSLIGI